MTTTCPVCDVPFHDVDEDQDGQLVATCANGHRFPCTGLRTFIDRPDEYDLGPQIT